MSKLVIVEDDMAIATMYQFKLEQSGYEVVLALDGVSALKVIDEHRPEVILLDLMLPLMTGSEVLAKLRETEWGKNLKVIVLTNINEDQAPAELRQLAIDRYVVKAQYTPSQVTVIVNEIMGVVDGQN
jgi:DNA-binding response OmpR family regulator